MKGKTIQKVEPLESEAVAEFDWMEFCKALNRQITISFDTFYSRPSSVNAKEHKKNKGPTEHYIQATAVSYLRLKMPEDFIIYAIPNGGLRHKAEAKKLKAEGVLPGMPDLCIPIARMGYHGLYIEVKTEKGRASAKQKDIHEKLIKQGYMVRVCRSWKSICSTAADYYFDRLSELEVFTKNLTLDEHEIHGETIDV